MKSIDEIREMSLDELERISIEGSVDIPSNLSGRSEDLIRRQRRDRYLGGLAGFVAGAAVLIGLLGSGGTTPKDTYSDPYLAYAEVEKAFATIGSAAKNSANTVENTRKQYEATINNIFIISE